MVLKISELHWLLPLLLDMVLFAAITILVVIAGSSIFPLSVDESTIEAVGRVSVIVAPEVVVMVILWINNGLVFSNLDRLIKDES